MQNRNKSIFSWLASLVLLALFLYVRIKFNVQIDEFGKMLTIVSTIIAGAAIWNNPTNKEGF